MPASTSSSELSATGSGRSASPASPSAPSAGAAPPVQAAQQEHERDGSATATAATAIGGSGSQRRQAMPTSADTVLPPTTAQGCASGLAGTPNTSTALAPSGATSHGRPAS
jgi:hypothetical protein